MGNRTDKQRIVSLQKMVKVARDALMRLYYEPGAQDALDEMNRLDWQSKPSGLQGITGHGENVR